MEPSEVYMWDDFLSAAHKMAETGIASAKLYAGSATAADPATAHHYGLANVAAFLAQSMQESIQYDACDENNWSNQDVVNMVGGTAYAAASACGQLGQSYQDYTCSETLVLSVQAR